jgi:hypothetical protein
MKILIPKGYKPLKDREFIKQNDICYNGKNWILITNQDKNLGIYIKKFHKIIARKIS